MIEKPRPGSGVRLKDVAEDDLSVFFDQQLDPDANAMAAFTVKNPADRAAFGARWARILEDETVVKKTVLLGDEVAGNVGSFVHAGEREVTYGLGRTYWGRGVATAALRLFLAEVTVRPLHARFAQGNVASLRVLERCGFTPCGEDQGFANARGRGVEEFILRLATVETKNSDRPEGV